MDVIIFAMSASSPTMGVDGGMNHHASALIATSHPRSELHLPAVRSSVGEEAVEGGGGMFLFPPSGPSSTLHAGISLSNRRSSPHDGAASMHSMKDARPEGVVVEEREKPVVSPASQPAPPHIPPVRITDVEMRSMSKPVAAYYRRTMDSMESFERDNKTLSERVREWRQNAQNRVDGYADLEENEMPHQDHQNVLLIHLSSFSLLKIPLI